MLADSAHELYQVEKLHLVNVQLKVFVARLFGVLVLKIDFDLSILKRFVCL